MTNLLHINGTNYTVAAESLLPKGKRAYKRVQRPSQATDPGQMAVKRWKLSGPIGRSRQGEDGFLGHDHSSLETRYEDLLTSLGAVTAATISGSDPLSTGSSALGALVLGGRALGGGTSGTFPQPITHIKEANSRLFLARGALVTQIDIADWGVEETQALDAVVRGMELWSGKLRIGLGGTDNIQTVVGVTGTGATYSDSTVGGSAVFGKEMLAGNDRLWLVRGEPGSNENKLQFITGDFAAIGPSDGFVVGDQGNNATSLGHMGPFMVVGGVRGVYSFTDDGVPFSLIDSLKDAPSTENGRKMASIFGWLYVVTHLGLYALQPGVSNPVGIGSESMWGFEGWEGRPVAVHPFREGLLVCYEDSAQATWRILIGVFNPNLTVGTGELDWYTVAHRTNAAVRCIGATATSTLPHIVWGEGASTLARVPRGRGGRDISDSSYTYSTAGGVWFGTTLMENQHLRKTVRWARVFSENCDASNHWTVAVSFDGGSYTNIGSSITTNGAVKRVPATLTSAPTGHAPKPRLTQVAASSTLPPQLRGYLEIAFDERPDTVTEVEAYLSLSPTQAAALRNLADGESKTQPCEMRLTDEYGTLAYGYVTDVEETDITGPDSTTALVRLVLVDAS